jgi:hypothetical protein
MNKNELNPTEKLMRDVRLIKAHTDYDMIEIEQIDKHYNRVESVQVFKYTVKMDASDPENPTVGELKGDITAGTLLFVDNPYPNQKPFGTGRVAYLVNDKKKNFDGALSGEERGRNLEYLAANYASNLFKIIDPEWEKVVKKRHEAIVKAQGAAKPKHVFPDRYNRGLVDDRVKIQVEHPQSVQEMITNFQKVLDSVQAENRELKSQLGILEVQPEKKKPKTKPVVEKKDSPIESAFAEV